MPGESLPGGVSIVPKALVETSYRPANQHVRHELFDATPEPPRKVEVVIDDAIVVPSVCIPPLHTKCIDGRRIEAALFCKRDHLLALIRCQDAADSENARCKFLPFHIG